MATTGSFIAPRSLGGGWSTTFTRSCSESTLMSPMVLRPRRCAQHLGGPPAGCQLHNPRTLWALLAGEPGYIDPTSGLFVQTARTLWERGACCGQGCRHCSFVDR